MTAASDYVTDQQHAQNIKRQERDACLAEFVKLYREPIAPGAETKLYDATAYWEWMRGDDDVAAIKREARQQVAAELVNRQAALPL